MPDEKTKTAEQKQAALPDDPKRELEEEVRFEAYRTYEWRCETHAPGSEFGDWLAAEKLVHARHAAPQNPAPGASK